MTADGSKAAAERVLAKLREGKRTHFSIERLARSVDLLPRKLEEVLDELARRGLVVRTRKGRVALAERLGMIIGVLRMGRGGRAIVIPDEPDAPVALPRGSILSAMDGDRVLVEASPYTRRGLRTGTVRAVIERRTERVVGTVVQGRRGGRVFVPRNPRAGYVASIENVADAASESSLVVARITEYPTRQRGPIVRIEREIGRPGNLPTEIETVCCTMGIPLDFPPEVNAAAAALLDPGTDEHHGRVDLRNCLLVTIDPADARDFDDAVGIEPTSTGFRLTVAIADVSHYVRPGSPLDIEALERGTSVYFPGRCIPMLPGALSGKVASLRPDADRLAVVAFLDVDRTGSVVKRSFARAVIRSGRRLTYGEAEDLLDRGVSNEPECEIARTLEIMGKCAALLHERRMARGAIDLDIPELEVEVDETGAPVALHRRPRLTANRIIEEFMLAANEAVAETLEDAGYPLIYRIHERPDEESIVSLTARLSLLGIRLEREGALLTPAVLQSAVEQAAGTGKERLVNTMCLKAMKQARYSAYKEIHFGLASPCYTHFTSPIRRYPDLVVHRLLCRVIESDRLEGPLAGRPLEPVAEQSSKRERRAMEAERDIDRAAAVLFIQQHVGRSFSGTVTGVDRRGYWVELDEVMVEGFVPVGRLSEYYEYVPERMELHSRTSNRVVRIGMKQRVRVDSAELAERRIDLTPDEE